MIHSGSNNIDANTRRGLLGVYLDDVSEIVAQLVPHHEFVAIHNTNDGRLSRMTASPFAARTRRALPSHGAGETQP